MIKNIFSVIIFLLIFTFMYFIFSFYLSENNQKKININRKNIYQKVNNNLDNLPYLKNDTKNVIEFNSGYNIDSNKIKRNFWNLFKNE